MSTPYDFNDEERCRFLDRLSRSQCPLTVGEARFIEQLGERENFTPGERTKIDRLRARFGPELRKEAAK